MIEYNRSSLLRVVFKCQGSVLGRVWPYVLVAMLEALVLACLKIQMGTRYPVTVTHPWTVVGSCLSFLLVFRTNTSYSRYWTGRTMLSKMLECARELMRMTVVYCGKYKLIDEGRPASVENLVQYDDEFLMHSRDEVRRLIQALFFCIIMMLKRTGDTDNKDPEVILFTRDELEEDMSWLRKHGMITDGEHKILVDCKVTRGSCVAPSIIATWLTQRIKMFTDMGHGPPPPVQAKMDNLITGFISAWMECETIVVTPLVFPYNQMLGMCLVFFIYTIPLPIANEFFQTDVSHDSHFDRTMGVVMTVGMTGLLALTFFGLNAIGMEIEDPFGDDLNDLPLADVAARVPYGTGSIWALRQPKQQSGDDARLSRSTSQRQSQEEHLLADFKKQLDTLDSGRAAHRRKTRHRLKGAVHQAAGPPRGHAISPGLDTITTYAQGASQGEGPRGSDVSYSAYSNT